MMQKDYYTYKTPCYVIDKSKFLDNLMIIKKNFEKSWGENILLGYSIKTNHLPAFLDLAKSQGMVAETVSDDEYYYAVEMGYDKKQIIFNGPQKTEACLLDALNSSSIVNIDNMDEILMIEKNYSSLKHERLKVGIRVNFDLEKICKGETTAGTQKSRFGICIENNDFEIAVKKLINLNIRIKGIHLHYSTKTRSLKVFETLAEKACEICKKHKLLKDIEYIDIGGGFWGGRYVKGKPTMLEYSTRIANILKETFDSKKVQLILEPGAALLATAAIYLSRVRNVRTICDTRFVTVDGSLLHINPFIVSRVPEYRLYPSGTKEISKQVVCGSTCMEDDRILQLYNEKELSKGDYIQIENVGAYTMSFNNCFINFPPYVYLKEEKKSVLVREKNKQIVFEI